MTTNAQTSATPAVTLYAVLVPLTYGDEMSVCEGTLEECSKYMADCLERHKNRIENDKTYHKNHTPMDNCLICQHRQKGPQMRLVLLDSVPN